MMTLSHKPFHLLCLPFIRLQGRLLQSLGACRERQQRLALDLAGHHKHIGHEGVDVASDVLSHHLGPLRVVPTVRQQRGHHLQEKEPCDACSGGGSVLIDM